jgi:hypothetical protein
MWQAPDIEVTLNGYSRTGCVEQMSVEAACSAPLARLFLLLSNIRYEWEDGAAEYDPLLVKWGMRGETLNPLFDGSVLYAYQNERLAIKALCRARQLTETAVTRTYRKETAAAIVRHLIEGLNFSSAQIADDETIIERLPLADAKIAQAIRLIGINNALYCDASGGFHWAPPDYEQAAVAVFAHGRDVIEFGSTTPNHYLLKTFAAPVWHGQVIAIADLDGTEKRYFVEQVRHTVGFNDEGARSLLWLKGLEA